MQLNLVLTVRDQAALDTFVNEVSDPVSPLYRQYLTVTEFTSRFGPTSADYQAVVQFAEENGLTVVGGTLDGMNVQVQGPVSAIEAAFHVTLATYQHPTENRIFYSPDR